MRGHQTVPLALVLLDPLAQTTLLGRRLRQLRSHVGQRQALCFKVGDCLLVAGAHEVALSLQFFGAPRDTALLGRRLLQLRVQLGQCLA